MKVYPNKIIVIIWDNAGWHKSKEFKEFLSNVNGRLHLINFPPYAPDYNPQKHVWNAERQKVTHNKFIKNIDQTTNEFIAFLNNTKFDYKFLDFK